MTTDTIRYNGRLDAMIRRIYLALIAGGVVIAGAILIVATDSPTPAPTTPIRLADQQVVGDAVYDLTTDSFSVLVAGGTCTVGEPRGVSGAVRLKPIEPPGGTFVVHTFGVSVIDTPANEAGECELGSPFTDTAGLNATHTDPIAQAGKRAAAAHMLAQHQAGIDPVWRVEVSVVDNVSGVESNAVSDLFHIMFKEKQSS